MGGRPVWVGMIDVEPIEGNASSETTPGAYVWVAAPASGWQELAEAARIALEARGFIAVEANDMQEAHAGALGGAPEQVAAEAARLQETVIDSTFFCYPADEEDEG